MVASPSDIPAQESSLSQGDTSAQRPIQPKRVTHTKRAEPEELGKARIVRGKKWYITLSALAGGVVSLISGTYGVVQFVEIKPLKEQISELRQSITSLETHNQSIKSQMERLRQQYDGFLLTTEKPILAFPPDLASIIGVDVTFIWDYKNHGSVSGYVLELQELSHQEVAPIKLNVVRPETKRMHYTLGHATGGEYLWRIRPGSLVGSTVVAQGPWSNAYTFRAYATVLDRIRSTGKVLLATTPTSYDAFVATDGKDQYSGYEMELIRWIVSELGKKLQLAPGPSIEVLQVPWSQMFNTMQNGEADIAIRSITRSATRELEYPTLRFSNGYIENQQIFVRLNQEGTFPGSLRNAIVGVKANSLNEKAARFLAPQFKFTVDASYVAYGDLYQSLREGRINFALVDRTLVAKFLGRLVHQFGGPLDPLLKSFYHNELGRGKEEYAILVHQSSPKDELREILNSILASPEFTAFNNTLKAQYGL